MGSMSFDKSNNTAIFNLDTYRGNGFIHATKVVDIARIRIVSLSNLGNVPASTDVMVRYASGGVEFISRQELVKRFRLASGKKIIIPYLKADTDYLVTCKSNKPYAVILLPSNMTGILRGKKVDANNYIVAPRTPEGTIEFDKMAFMPKTTFRKMFSIPMQDVIKNNIGKNNTYSNRINTKQRKEMQAAIGDFAVRMGLEALVKDTDEPVNSNLNFGLNANNINIPSINDRKSVNQPKANADTSRANFRAVGRIVNEKKELLGFIIEDRKGNKRTLSEQMVMKMANEHMIVNLMLSRTDSGKPYLRGNGISIEQLPHYLP